MKVRILKQIMVAGVRVKPGTVVDVSDRDAAYLRAVGKAELPGDSADEKPAPEGGKPSAPTAPPRRASKKKVSKKKTAAKAPTSRRGSRKK